MTDYADQEDFNDELFGRGEGDQDAHPKYWIGDKPKVKRIYEDLGRRKGYPFNPDIDYDPLMDEDLDDWREDV